MRKYSPLILKTLLASLLLHYLFIHYFPVEWFNRLNLFNDQYIYQQDSPRTLEAFLVGDSASPVTFDSNEQGAEGNQGKLSEGGMEGIDEEKWKDLISRLDENNGFAQNYVQSYDNLLEKRRVSDSYIYRERKHEDIVVKDVFPTIHNIDQPFETTLTAAKDQLEEYENRNEIIEQYRSPSSPDESDLIVGIIKQNGEHKLGPLKFPEAERQKFFDKTLTQDKTSQLSNFIDKYFQYDPNEGDLPIATRELYAKNLERLLYTFSSDPSYLFLDFYLENLNKEDFLHKALYQASRLDGSKTSTELLFSIERIYEIQQRAWRSYFEFERLYEKITEEKRSRLRIETLHRVDKRYKSVLQQKEIKEYDELEKKYLQRRYEIMEHIIINTPEKYRLHDAYFEQAAILWDTALKTENDQLTRQAISQWQSLIDQARQHDFSENAFNDFTNLKHLKHLEALIKAYQREPQSKKAARARQISSLLLQRHNERLATKREREGRLLWPQQSSQ
jgi:hypothetical protein